MVFHHADVRTEELVAVLWEGWYMTHGYFPKLSQESYRKPPKFQVHTHMLWGEWEEKTTMESQKKDTIWDKGASCMQSRMGETKGKFELWRWENAHCESRGRKEKLGNKNSGTRKRKINGMYRTHTSLRKLYTLIKWWCFQAPQAKKWRIGRSWFLLYSLQCPMKQSGQLFPPGRQGRGEGCRQQRYEGNIKDNSSTYSYCNRGESW